MPRRTQDTSRSWGSFRLPGYHCLWLNFPVYSASAQVPRSGPTTPTQSRFGLIPVRSPLLRESLLFSFPPGTKMFQFPGFSSLKLCIGLRMITHFLVIGFPHSDTPGSLNVYFSPRRFAVFCVLLLLYMPRHPPYALLHLITLLENF